MKKMNKGAISIFSLLAMMFFLIFIMVAYNNVMQKGKTQVETEGVLVDYYQSAQTATEITGALDGGTVTDGNKTTLLKETAEQEKLSENSGKYVYSNGKIYKIQ
ncbi:MAG: hypothetical protein IJ629_01450 [Clostridia bacterium]|nr:hypothetical protein [Clostridia bacterium]